MLLDYDDAQIDCDVYGKPEHKADVEARARVLSNTIFSFRFGGMPGEILQVKGCSPISVGRRISCQAAMRSLGRLELIWKCSP